MKRLPRGTKAQIMGTRLFQTMYTADQMRKAVADEREAIIDEWWSIVQADLENGVKSLNEQAAIKWRKEYPSMATFGEWLEARGNA